MFWNKYFAPSFLVLVLVAILHWIASELGYYWTVEWYDYMMHFLGGVWVTLFILWAAATSYGVKLRPFITTKKLILYTFAVGVLWEILEVILHFSDPSISGYTWDTTHDLIMDVVGALFVVYLVYRKSNTTQS